MGDKGKEIRRAMRRRRKRKSEKKKTSIEEGRKMSFVRGIVYREEEMTRKVRENKEEIRRAVTRRSQVGGEEIRTAVRRRKGKMWGRDKNAEEKIWVRDEMSGEVKEKDGV